MRSTECPSSISYIELLSLPRSLYDIAGGMTSLVGWLLVVTKADCDLSNTNRNPL